MTKKLKSTCLHQFMKNYHVLGYLKDIAQDVAIAYHGTNGRYSDLYVSEGCISFRVYDEESWNPEYRLIEIKSEDLLDIEVYLYNLQEKLDEEREEARRALKARASEEMAKIESEKEESEKALLVELIGKYGVPKED